MMDAYVGLGSDSLLLWGSMGTAGFLLIYAIVLYFLNASLIKRGVYILSILAMYFGFRLDMQMAIIRQKPTAMQWFTPMEKQRS